MWGQAHCPKSPSNKIVFLSLVLLFLYLLTNRIACLLLLGTAPLPCPTDHDPPTLGAALHASPGACHGLLGRREDWGPQRLHSALAGMRSEHWSQQGRGRPGQLRRGEPRKLAGACACSLRCGRRCCLASPRRHTPCPAHPVPQVGTVQLRPRLGARGPAADLAAVQQPAPQPQPPAAAEPVKISLHDCLACRWGPTLGP